MHILDNISAICGGVVNSTLSDLNHLSITIPVEALEGKLTYQEKFSIDDCPCILHIRRNNNKFNSYVETRNKNHPSMKNFEYEAFHLNSNLVFDIVY